MPQCHVLGGLEQVQAVPHALWAVLRYSLLLEHYLSSLASSAKEDNKQVYGGGMETLYSGAPMATGASWGDGRR